MAFDEAAVSFASSCFTGGDSFFSAFAKNPLDAGCAVFAILAGAVVEAGVGAGAGAGGGIGAPDLRYGDIGISMAGM